MLTPSPRTVARSLGVLAVASLASCSMPSQEAWNQIQKEGLIPYVINARRQQAAQTTAQQVAQQAPTPVLSTTPKVVSTPPGPVTPTVVNRSVPPPSQLRSDALLTAQAVPGLPGYVRSPFTNPPRLVDVRGMGAGSKVVCPYTRKPFLVPSGAVQEAPQQQVASAPEPAPLPKPQPQPQPQAAPAPAPKVTQQAPSAPTKVAVNSTPAPQPPPQPQAKPNPPVVQQTPPPAPAPAPSELPFGTAIPGRPGFVNSPYAAKHQLVDVTGLPTGMEVKCPYTGKLFRVPPQTDGSAPPKN